MFIRQQRRWWFASASQPASCGNAPSSSMLVVVAELTGCRPQTTTGSEKIVYAVAALDVGDRVLPALVAQAAATPPAQASGLHAQAVASTAEGAGASVLTAARAGHAPQARVAADQLEEINPLFEGTDIDGHAASLAGDHLNDAQMDLRRCSSATGQAGVLRHASGAWNASITGSFE